MDMKTVDTAVVILAWLFVAFCVVRLFISLMDEWRWKRRTRDEHEDLHGDVPAPREGKR